MTSLKLSTAALALAVFAPAAMAQGLMVTNGNDDGEGSLRAALAAAAEGGVITLAPGLSVEINSTLDYAGTAPLTILGHGGTVQAAQDVTVLSASNGASLTLRDLTLRGPGGFSLENQGSGKGIFVDVRDDQEGAVVLDLAGVTVSGTAAHGVHVSDCDLADECGRGGGGAGEGSAASITVHLSDVLISDVGNGSFDADGLRVDERGLGDITAVIAGSTFTGVGADGIELDEGQAGHVFASVTGSAFTHNGIYCDPAILAPLMPAEPEGEFAQGAMAEDAIPGPVTGTPDDSCIEREVDLYDDGSVEEYAFGIDLDDGFDIDEAGPGSLISNLSGITVIGNLDEGIDFDEENEGDLRVVIQGSNAEGNTDDGYKFSEVDAGGIFAEVGTSRAAMNGGKGFVFEAENEGFLYGIITNTLTAGNDDGDQTGLELLNEGQEPGEVAIVASDFEDGIDAENVNVTQ